MKANSCGTMVEQSRARMGWKTASERKACGADPKKICRTCKFSDFPSYQTADGSYDFAVRCVSLFSSGAGFATRVTAGCDKWESDLS